MAALYDFNHQPEKWNLSIQVEGIISTTRQDRPDIHQWGSTASTSCPSHIHDRLPVYASHWWSIEDSISSHQNWGKKNYSNSSIPQDTSVWWWVTFLIIYPLPFIVADIKPFVLHMLPEEEAYLCPVQAFTDWISASCITSGYVFRRMAAGDRPVANNLPMVFSLPKFNWTSLMFIIDFRTIARDVPQWFTGYQHWPLSLWHPLVPSWGLPVLCLNSTMEAMSYLWLGWVEHGVFKLDHHQVLDLMEWWAWGESG